jgi:hypothetical protein
VPGHSEHSFILSSSKDLSNCPDELSKKPFTLSLPECDAFSINRFTIKLFTPRPKRVLSSPKDRSVSR